jgi:hypothetical protein
MIEIGFVKGTVPVFVTVMVNVHGPPATHVALFAVLTTETLLVSCIWHECAHDL